LTTLAALMLLAGLTGPVLRALAALATLAALAALLRTLLLLRVALRVLLLVRHWDILRLLVGTAPLAATIATPDENRSSEHVQMRIASTVWNYRKKRMMR
jgi:hypothetical protein